MPQAGRPVRRWARALWAVLEARPVLCIAVAFLLFALALNNLGLVLPGKLYWRGWADQKAYLASAQAFATLRLDPALHWYPLLYALVAAPFAWMPSPFLPVNLAAFALSFVGFRQVCARFAVSTRGAVLLFLAATLLDPWTGKLWIEPWSTSLSSACLWLALGRTARALDPEYRIGARDGAILGALLTLVALARPADAMLSAIVGGFAFWQPTLLVRRPAPLLAGLGAALVLLAGYALLHLAIYGPKPSDYMLLSRDYGFNFALLGWKAATLLVDPHPWFPGGDALLPRLPWLILGAAGLLLGPLLLRGPARWLALCLGLCALTYSALMLAYVDLLPTGLLRFNNIHYFKWLFPLFALFAWLLVRWSAAHRVPALLATLGLIALTGLRYDPIPVAADAPARALVFAWRAYSAAKPSAQWAELYLARSVLDDARGRQRNFFDYHQIPIDDHAMVALGLRRDFVGGERWIGAPPPGATTWPRGDAGRDSPRLGAAPHPPIGRFAAQLRYGYPCWLPFAGCRSRHFGPDLSGNSATAATQPVHIADTAP